MLRASARFRPLPFPWPMRNGTVLALSPFDALGSPGTVGWTCLHKRTWEPHVERCLRDLLRPGDTVLDVGANLGYFSAVMAQAVGPSGRVFSFEPVPDTFEQLRLCALLNGFEWMTPLPVALGAAEGSIELAFDARNAGDASSHRPATRSAEQRVVRARVGRLDDLVAESAAAAPAVMKLDVEGHEFEVLQGARKTIADTHPAIVFEFAPSLAQHAGWRLADLAELISPDGEYAFFRLGERDPVKIDILRWTPEKECFACDLLARPVATSRQRRSTPRKVSPGA